MGESGDEHPEHPVWVACVRMFVPAESASETKNLSATRSAPARRVLGIDPGMTRCGYAVLETAGPTSTRAISLGVLRTDSSTSTPARLGQLLSDLEDLLDDFEPSVVALEQVFFQVNIRTAMAVGQVSGLAMALSARRGCQVAEFTPNQVKEAVTGWGGADKVQVQKMVQARLGLSRAPEPVDAADAAAVALCFLAMDPMQTRLVASGAQVVHGRLRAR